MIQIAVFFNALALTLGLAAGIGPQNTNLIEHAINRHHHYLVSIASFSEVILTIFGCVYFDHEKSKLVITIVNIAGILFLAYYLIGKLKSLSVSKQCNQVKHSQTKKQVVSRALMLVWCNPLVYVDTLVLIGGDSANYYGLQHLLFILGSVCGYSLWKFGAPTIISHYSQCLNRPPIWKALDIATICMVSYLLIKITFIVLHSFNIFPMV